MPNHAIQLHPCPFCGKQPDSRWCGAGPAGDDGYWGIDCCHAFAHADDEQEAAAQWNTRAQAAEPVAYVRRRPNGDLTEEIIPAGRIEDVRKESGVWLPLSLSTPTAPLPEAHTDSTLLEFMLKNSLAVVPMANGKYAIYNPSVYQMGDPVGTHDTPRAALEAAAGGVRCSS